LANLIDCPIDSLYILQGLSIPVNHFFKRKVHDD
jgi:hypothetical protein